MDSLDLPQCQYFVTRKKRLCRMTVRPGCQYCGEHEPQPQPTTDDGKVNSRIPCPYDPKHTCYVSKLEKHLAICNARQVELPTYIAHNVNAPPDTGNCQRTPLSEVPRERLMQVIDKINTLFQTYLQDKIEQIPERPIHHTVLPEFSESDRTESSLRHLRQASSLLHIVEELGLVRDATCYLELGAGKGQLSYYACCAWCDGGGGGGSCVALVERAARRHKRDGRARARGECVRVRADLAHVRLAAVPAVRDRPHLVGLAKHLCGVAMDYALRGLTAAELRARAAGAALATCCHHRCERAAYVGAAPLQELGINDEDLNIMLGVVSWATCGDGRSRERRGREGGDPGPLSGSQDQLHEPSAAAAAAGCEGPRGGDTSGGDAGPLSGSQDQLHEPSAAAAAAGCEGPRGGDTSGGDAGPLSGSQDQLHEPSAAAAAAGCEGPRGGDTSGGDAGPLSGSQDQLHEPSAAAAAAGCEGPRGGDTSGGDAGPLSGSQDQLHEPSAAAAAAGCEGPRGGDTSGGDAADRLQQTVLTQKHRERVGRRAKALLDWGRVLYLRDCGFDARLCHYVPTAVSLENLCIVARKIDHCL